MIPGDTDTDTIGDLHDRIEKAPASWVLATQIPEAKGASEAEVRSIYTDTFQSGKKPYEWEVQLNGTGRDFQQIVLTIGDSFPSPGRVRFPAGSALVKVNEQAAAVLKPDQGEYYVDEDDVVTFQDAIIQALYRRLVDLGLDLPPLDEAVPGWGSRPDPDPDADPDAADPDPDRSGSGEGDR